jgi:hypothetical protein
MADSWRKLVHPCRLLALPLLRNLLKENACIGNLGYTLYELSQDFQHLLKIIGI